MLHFVIILRVLLVPSLIKVGPDALAVHMFIIYFVPFLSLKNPSLVLQGRMADFALHFATAVLGVAPVCCGLQGCLVAVGDLRRCRSLEWPMRAALVVGGLMFVAPGGGLMPLTPWPMTAAARAVTLPAVLLARLRVARALRRSLTSQLGSCFEARARADCRLRFGARLRSGQRSVRQVTSHPSRSSPCSRSCAPTLPSTRHRV